MKIFNKYVATLLVLIAFAGCDKQAFLDERPNDSLVVPTTLDELQAILDNDQVMNGLGGPLASGPIPQLGEMASDNAYVLDNQYVTFTEIDQRFYTWTFVGRTMETLYDWDRPYQTIFYANTVLDGLSSSAESNERSEQIKAAALFYRSHTYYQLAQIFCPAYDPTAGDQTGVLWKGSSDINEHPVQLTLAETYERIIRDIKDGVDHLPSNLNMKSRPSRQAAHGLLARIYLMMADYEKALVYADSCLDMYNTLLDYNNVNAAATRPFAGRIAIDSEVIFNANLHEPLSNTPLNSLRSYVDTILIRSFDDNDLRKAILLRSYAAGHRFKGSYSGEHTYFAGIATNEIWLIKAECLARSGRMEEAIASLELILTNRWRKVDGLTTFPALVSGDSEALLDYIFLERRKELLYRGLRWPDIKRQNRDGKNISLQRMVLGERYTLDPNSEAWIFSPPGYVLY